MDGPTIKRHRAEIRRFVGFRTFTVADFDKLTDWLAGDYAQRVRRAELVREYFLAECRTRQLELKAIRSFTLPDGVFTDVAVTVVAEWRHLALIESPSHVRRRAEPVQVAMLAALLLARQPEITDALVQLLISTVHRIGLRAEKKVFRQLAAEFTRVNGKENLLLKLADAALRRPDETVRQVVFPLVGSDNLRNLAAEFKSCACIRRAPAGATAIRGWRRRW